MADPFGLEEDDLETDEDGADGATGADSTNLKEVRNFAKRLQRELKAAQKANEELSAFKTETETAVRKAQVETTFKSVGLNEKQAELFAKVNPEAEITEDTVRAFASEYGFAAVTGETVAAPEIKPAGFTPVTTGTAPELGLISLEDAEKMIHEGKFDEVQKLYSEGRVEKGQRDEGGSVKVDWLKGMK